MINKIVRDLVKKKVKNKDMFTSLDISNEIKESGIWISNRDVSSQLKEIFLKNYKRYTTSLISVKRTEDGVNVYATLYHNKKSNIDDYKNREGKAIKPPEITDCKKSSKINDDKVNKYRIFNFVN